MFLMFLKQIISALIYIMAPGTVSQGVNPFCQTPNGEAGLCKPMNECESLYSYHLNASNVTANQYIRHSHCGFTENHPKVCCTLLGTDPIPENSDAFVSTNLLASNDECIMSTQSKIFGGNKTALDEFPWMAALEYQNDDDTLSIKCGGFLINSQYVVTAAHCIKSTLVSVRLGEYDTKTNPDCLRDDCAPAYTTLSIEKKTIFKSYNTSDKNRYHDIALLRLKQKVNFSDFIKPICLPTTVNELYKSYIGERFFVAGWGLKEDDEYSNIKLKVEVPIQNCSEVYDAGQFCAEGEEGKGACVGDSGGALMAPKIDENGDIHWHAVGIVSGGPFPCGVKDLPGIYVKVSKYVSWIVDNLKP